MAWTRFNGGKAPAGSPCKGCEQRCAEPNCHDACEAYLAYKGKVQAARADIVAKTHNESEGQFRSTSGSYTSRRIAKFERAARKETKL